MNKRVFCLIAAALLVGLVSVTAAAAEDGVLMGVVVNGTENGGSTEGLAVTLRRFEGSEERERLSTTTDDAGRFRFESLDTGQEWAYLVRVVYQGVSYSSGVQTFGAERELAISLPVYEPTTDGGAIVVDRAHVLVTVAGAGLSVTELYVFRNPTDQTYVGTDEVDGRRWAAKFVLPEQSVNLTLDDGTLGGRFLSIPAGFVDTEPQWPGGTQVLYNYELSCPQGVCDLSRNISHPVSNLNVLISDANAQVESTQLVPQGVREAGKETYLNYEARGLAAGEELDLVVRLPGAVAPAARTQRGGTSALPWIILGALVVTAILVYPFWLRRVQEAARKE